MEFTMSKTEDQANETAEKTKKSPIGLIFIIIALTAVIVIYNLNENAKMTNDDNSKEEVAASSPAEITDTNTEEDQASTEQGKTSEESMIAESNVSNEFDLEKASTPRILGNPDAPIKISEHSSFTCGGCAMFHKGNFKLIKEEYIDTGKAYIVFDDFPRNMFDIKIGAVARCVPEKAYFDFVQLLFETQKTWLNESYESYLKQNAKLTGASEQQIDACLNNKELHETMANRQKAATDNHGVESTPTLVINDKATVSGLDTYANIKAVIEAAMVKSAE